MNQKTYISKVIEGNSNKDRYDAEVKKILSETSVEMKGGFRDMCNLSERIEQKGIEQGNGQSLYSLVNKGLLKMEDVAKEINVSVEEFAAKIEKADYYSLCFNV